MDKMKKIIKTEKARPNNRLQIILLVSLIFIVTSLNCHSRVPFLKENQTVTLLNMFRGRERKRERETDFGGVPGV